MTCPNRLIHLESCSIVPDSMMPSEIFSCPMCLAVYEKRKEKRANKERGSFGCSCGHLIARWYSFFVPIFTKLRDSTITIA
jgi:hypothetical protein